MNWRLLAATGALHVFLAGALSLVFVRELGWAAHAAVSLSLLVPLLLAAFPLLRGSGFGFPARRMLLVVVGAGLLSRALLVTVPPSPEADIHRMIWEGRVPSVGGDPYRHAPDDPELAELASILPETYAGVNYWKLPAIYPPAAQLFFRVATAVSVHPSVMKAALVLVEGFLVLALVLLLRRRGLPAGLVILYVWNPLPLTEIAGGGHVDALGVALLGLGILAAESARPAAASCLAALSALSKIAGRGCSSRSCCSLPGARLAGPSGCCSPPWEPRWWSPPRSSLPASSTGGSWRVSGR